MVAYNLITLRDRLASFRTLSDEGLLVRMETLEADLYGQRVVWRSSNGQDQPCALDTV